MRLKGKYSRFIPSIYKEAEKDASFMERYFRIFEDILDGIDIDRIEKDDIGRIDIISGLFHPGFTFLFDNKIRTFIPPLEEKHVKKFRDLFSTDMDDFLAWFAGWMGLSLKENWDKQTRRAILAKIIPLYRIRGTKRGLEEYLKICTGYSVEIIEELKSFQVGITSHVGIDMILGGLPPYHFIVNVIVPGKDDILLSKRKMIEELINMEKPAHTTFKLRINYEKKI